MKKYIGYSLFLSAFLLIVGLAFPVLFDKDTAGRVTKEEDINLSFLNNSTSSTILIYFGYVGCTNVCEPSLKEIAKIYNEHILTDKNANLDIFFVNMTTEVDAQTVSLWAKSFHNNFKSFAPTKDELLKITHKLGLIYSDLGLKAEHLPYLYLIRKTDNGYKLKYIYTTRPYNEKLILKDLSNTKGVSQ